MKIENTPVLGGTAPRNATRTAKKLAGFALRWINSIESSLGRLRYLDVGCGNGFITELVAPGFEEVVGIDVEAARLEDFRAHSGNRSNSRVLLMSAANMEFPGKLFQFITAFEVLEHVPDLQASVGEMVRVCDDGGIIVVSVPQVRFPFENHGAQIGDRLYTGKILLLPYIRPLHRKYSLARVFSSAEMDQLFLSNGNRRAAAIVVGQRLFGMHGHVQRDGKIASRARLPQDPIVGAPQGGDVDFLG